MTQPKRALALVAAAALLATPARAKKTSARPKPKPLTMINLPGRPAWRMASPPGYALAQSGALKDDRGRPGGVMHWAREFKSKDGRPQREHILWVNYVDDFANPRPKGKQIVFNFFPKNVKIAPQPNGRLNRPAIKLTEGSHYGFPTAAEIVEAAADQDWGRSRLHLYRVAFIGDEAVFSGLDKLRDDWYIGLVAYWHEWAGPDVAPPSTLEPGYEDFLRIRSTLSPVAPRVEGAAQ
jgi:hypothetical protein